MTTPCCGGRKIELLHLKGWCKSASAITNCLRVFFCCFFLKKNKRQSSKWKQVKVSANNNLPCIPVTCWMLLEPSLSKQISRMKGSKSWIAFGRACSSLYPLMGQKKITKKKESPYLQILATSRCTNWTKMAVETWSLQ